MQICLFFISVFEFPYLYISCNLSQPQNNLYLIIIQGRNYWNRSLNSNADHHLKNHLKKVIFRWEINTESRVIKLVLFPCLCFSFIILGWFIISACGSVVMSKDFRIRQTQSQGSGLLLANHVTLGKLYHFSIPWFPQLYSSTYLIRLLGRLNELCI